jgi:neurofibromin 1
VELLADCTAAHWDAIDSVPKPAAGDEDRAFSALPSRKSRRRDIDPPSLDEGQAKYAMDLLLRLIATPTQADELASQGSGGKSNTGSLAEEKSLDGLPKKATDLERATFKVIEFLSASNWNLVYHAMKAKLKYLRTSSAEDLDAGGLQFIAHLSLNQRKLSLVIQEISGSFLPLRKAAQNTLAALLPEAIHRWIDSHPKDFVNLHMTPHRLEGGADVLFDFATSLADSKRRTIIWPLQTALILLLPEVFIHADMNGSQRGNSLAKKIVFLNNLRQALKLPKSADIAASCLITICRAGSLFPADSDSALLGFAQDIQNDMSAEIFKRHSHGTAMEDAMDRDVLIKAFVSLARLSVDSVVEHLIPKCLDKNSPMSFKITVFAGAAVLASQSNSEQYASLFKVIAPDLREYLHGVSSMRDAAHNGNAQQFNSTVTDKMRQKNISSDSIGSVELLYQLLELLKIRPILLYENFDASSGPDEWDRLADGSVNAILKLISDDDEFVRNSTVIFARRMMSPEAFHLASRMEILRQDDNVLNFFWAGT